ncbi:hypothetical protein TNCV_395981 [Trichonephila clavipes]|nr:hypothetical protein TNCV_395981 [Trichonephila clavipes]
MSKKDKQRPSKGLLDFGAGVSSSTIRKRLVEGCKLGADTRSEDETLPPDYTQQTTKHPSKQMFWDLFTTNTL